MRTSKTLARIRAGQPARIAMMGHFLPPFIAHAAHAGYDGIWLDLEHRPMDAREIQALMAFFHLYDIDCLLRTPTREKGQLYRYLEDGATGLIVPHVSTPEEAADLVRKVKFPPVGDRGVEGRGLETNYGLDIAGGRNLIVEHAQRETLLVVQIETPEALANVDAIAAVPGVDGLYVGPGDLGIRMAYEPEDKRVAGVEVMKIMADACQRQGKAWGYFPATIDDVKAQRDLGADLLVWGVDIRMIVAGLSQNGAELDAVLDAS